MKRSDSGGSGAASTIYDIAGMTGFSPATVSRALNHPEQVSSGTLEVIRAAVRGSGFSRREYRSAAAPREAAHTNRYLLLIPGTSNPFYDRIIEGAVSAAGAHNCRLLVDYAAFSAQGQPVSLPEKAGLYDGIILMTASDDGITRRIAEQVPLVQCSEYSEQLQEVSCVSIDDEAGMRAATEHILSLGFSRIACVSCSPHMHYALRRLRGFRGACAARGLPEDSQRVVTLPHTGFEVAHTAALRLLSAPDRPEALVCSSDVYAIAALKAAHELGISVPGELSVIGFDDIPLASMVDPALSTVRQPCYQLGFTAFETLFREVHEPNTEKQRIFLPTELIVRETTGA